MQHILFATSNAEKFREVSACLSPFAISLERAELDVDEIKSLDIVKTAREKAQDSFALLKRPLVVEDTGIFFNAFNSFPGTYSKFCIETIGVRDTVGLLKGKKDTSASFVTVACYTDGKTTECFEGRVDGQVVLSPRGNPPAKLPYDSYFVPIGSTRTYAEMALEEKNGFSHRSRAFEKFAQWFKASQASIGREKK